MLGSNSVSFKPNGWIIQMMVVDCHKRLSLPSLDTKWFSDEMVKARSKN